MSIWKKITDLGLDSDVSLADIKHIQLCNIITLASAVVTLSTVFLYLKFLPDTIILVLSAVLITLLYLLTLVFNRLKKFNFARIYLGILGIVVMTMNTFVFPDANTHYLFIVAIFLHFFLYPYRYRLIMYIHASILSLLFLYFCIASPDIPLIIHITPEINKLVANSFPSILPLYASIPCFFIYITFWKAEVALSNERAKSDKLLLNILPESIAERLKKNTESIADYFDSATILFADIVNFTKLSNTISATDLVNLLDNIFIKFDQITDQYNLEKIKTIGDAYMVVGGIPDPNPNHVQAIANMALEMLEVFKNDQQLSGLNIRIGFHSGPIVAGVIGRKKFSYDLWGDSVNVASRMESHGKEGFIQVTETVYNELSDTFLFEERGSINIKGKGEIKTYFLLGKKI